MTSPDEPQDEFSRKLQELIAEIGDQAPGDPSLDPGAEPEDPSLAALSAGMTSLASSQPPAPTPPIVPSPEVKENPLDLVLQRLDRLEKHLGSEGELQQLLSEMLRKSAEEAGMRRLFDSLHAELKGYKDDFLFDAMQRPVIMDLVALLDDLKALHAQSADPRTGTAKARVPKEIEQNLRNSVAHLGEILERLGVEEVAEGNGSLDRALHRLARTEPTSDASQDGVIAKVLRCGFVWRGRLLRPADVVVYRCAEAIPE